MVCWMVEISERTAESKSALIKIREDGAERARLVLRALLKLSKSILQKSRVGGLSVREIDGQDYGQVVGIWWMDMRGGVAGGDEVESMVGNPDIVGAHLLVGAGLIRRHA